MALKCGDAGTNVVQNELMKLYTVPSETWLRKVLGGYSLCQILRICETREWKQCKYMKWGKLEVQWT